MTTGTTTMSTRARTLGPVCGTSIVTKPSSTPILTSPTFTTGTRTVSDGFPRWATEVQRPAAGAMPDRMADWRAILDRARAGITAADGALRVEFDADLDLGELSRLVSATGMAAFSWSRVDGFPMAIKRAGLRRHSS